MNNIKINSNMMKVTELFDSGRSIAWNYLAELDWIWDALPHIESYVQKLGPTLDSADYEGWPETFFEEKPENVWIHKSADIAPSAFIGPNVIIGANTQVRHCAFVRGPAIIGENAVIGNSTELKNSILFDGVQVPHYNYIGDSIFGYKAHTGAGVITSNVKSDSSLVDVVCGDERIATSLKKFGAILGDFVEVGCNAVLNPGTVIGPKTNIYPLSMVRGFLPANSIYKKQGEVIEKR